MKNEKVILTERLKELDVIAGELDALPEGYLAKKKASTYYHVIKDRQVGITRNTPLIQQLCRKRYLLARKGQLEQNLVATTPDELDMRPPQELIATLPKAYQSAPIHYFYHPSVDKWKGRPPMHEIHPESAIYTYNSIRFRSMAERIIAELLDKNGLLYRYEFTLGLMDRDVSPDFIVKNPFTNKMVIWEHFGGFNHKNYADGMNDKMDAYLNQGFCPSKDLITTYQYHIRNPERIQKIIDKMIL